jgi:hypothetical protein
MQQDRPIRNKVRKPNASELEHDKSFISRAKEARGIAGACRGLAERIAELELQY